VLPFELLILATPVSRQVRRLQKRSGWREEIRTAAAAEWDESQAPVAQAVALKIGYFYHGGSFDLDNIINPIQNGLEGIVFSNDSLVVDLVASKRPLEGVFRVAMSPKLARGFASGTSYILLLLLQARSRYFDDQPRKPKAPGSCRRLCAAWISSSLKAARRSVAGILATVLA